MTNFIDLLIELTRKEIKTRYSNAMFGFLWIIINPLLQMIVIGVVFSFFIPVEIDNYFLFLFTGLLPWNFFSETIKNSTTIFLSERGLVKNVNMPREALVLAIVLSNAFHLCISTLILIWLLIMDKLVIELYPIPQTISYALRMLNVLPLYISLVLLTSSFSLILSLYNTKYRDIQFIVQSILPLLFYATPIIYTRNLLPEHVAKLLSFNPLTHIAENIHDILLQGTIQPYNILTTLIVACVFFTLSFMLFQKESRNISDWV